jgi:hypothetical protein
MRKIAVDRVNAWLVDRARSGRSWIDARLYLDSLGTRLIRLRDSFDEAKVSVDYTDPATIETYLLAYFPHYIASAVYALEILPAERYRQYLSRGFKIVFVGGGPLPEVVALAEVLESCTQNQVDIEIVLIDAHAATWSAAARDAVALAKGMNPRLNINLKTIVHDVRKPFDERVERAIASSDVVMLQNCLNEVVKSSAFDHNCMALAECLRGGGAFIVCDLHRYEAALYAVEKIRVLFARRLKMLREFTPVGGQHSPFENPPPLLFWNLYGAKKAADDSPYRYDFEDGRVPRRYLYSSAAIWEK